MFVMLLKKFFFVCVRGFISAVRLSFLFVAFSFLLSTDLFAPPSGLFSSAKPRSELSCQSSAKLESKDLSSLCDVVKHFLAKSSVCESVDADLLCSHLEDLVKNLSISVRFATATVARFLEAVSSANKIVELFPDNFLKRFVRNFSGDSSGEGISGKDIIFSIFHGPRTTYLKTVDLLAMYELENSEILKKLFHIVSVAFLEQLEKMLSVLLFFSTLSEPSKISFSGDKLVFSLALSHNLRSGAGSVRDGEKNFSFEILAQNIDLFRTILRSAVDANLKALEKVSGKPSVFDSARVESIYSFLTRNQTLSACFDRIFGILKLSPTFGERLRELIIFPVYRRIAELVAQYTHRSELLPLRKLVGTDPVSTNGSELISRILHGVDSESGKKKIEHVMENLISLFD